MFTPIECIRRIRVERGNERRKKHPCLDCTMCQWCSDDRCRLCLKTGGGKKLSMSEQIALYEALCQEDGKLRNVDEKS